MMKMISLQGRLATAPKLRKTDKGVSVTDFTLARESYYKGEALVSFYHIVAWRNHAELICKYFGRGNRIGITGWVNDGDGAQPDPKNPMTEVTVQSVRFLGRERTNSFDPVAPDDSSLPF